MLTREPKEPWRAVLQQPPRLPKSLAVWCMRQELCPLQPQETGAGGGWSKNHTLRGTEAPDAQGLTSTLLTGAQDTTGGTRRPQGHAGLRRHPTPPGSRPCQSPGPTCAFPAPGRTPGRLFMGKSTPFGQRGLPPLAQCWSQSPCRDSGFADDAHGTWHLPPGPESPTHLSWATPR